MSNVNTNIIPASDLKNNFNEVVKAVHESSRPVILTENGSEDMIIMSYRTYQNLLFDLEADIKIAQAEIEEEYNDKRYTHEEMYEAMLAAIDVRANV